MPFTVLECVNKDIIYLYVSVLWPVTLNVIYYHSYVALSRTVFVANVSLLFHLSDRHNIAC